MKRVMAALLLSVSLTLGMLGTVPSATAADRVRCDFRGGYRVTCYNNTQYQVRVRLNLFTTCGLRIKYFAIRGYSHSLYSPCYINRMTWRWDFS